MTLPTAEKTCGADRICKKLISNRGVKTLCKIRKERGSVSKKIDLKERDFGNKL
jgi:hypothetical protein